MRNVSKLPGSPIPRRAAARLRPWFVAIGIAAVSACTTIREPAGSDPALIDQVASPPGYLTKDEYPDGIALSPPPPEPGSTAFAVDEEISRANLALRGTPRWDLAADDAWMRFPKAAGPMSCALGVGISKEATPYTYVMLRRIAVDVGQSVRPAKKHFQRKRPFMVNDEPVCTPTSKRYLNADASYPSGHSAVGWTRALILADIAPTKAAADAVLVRGLEIGQSRVVCNVHWQSDVAQSRVIAAALVARLHANETFRADLRIARREIAEAHAQGLPPTGNCIADAKALGRESSADAN